MKSPASKKAAAMTGGLAIVRPSLADARALRDGPHEFLLALRRSHGPAIRFGVGNFSFFMLSDPEHVQSVLIVGHREFTRRAFQYRLLASVTGDGLLTMDGAEWLKRRRREQPLFQLEAVRSWTGLIVGATERILDEWETSARTGSPRDVARDMLRLALDGNPLDDIRETRNIMYVMKAGVMYDATSLDEVWPATTPVGTHWWVNPDALKADRKSITPRN